MNNRDLSGEAVQADDLTWREQEILTLLAERLTNREIANRLHLAESTVKDYVGKILSKLYVKNRRQAVERAKALGLLDGDRKTRVKPPTNLPAEPTPFVGRREELGEIKRQLAETRLLTLTGPGGIGKSRLALKTAQEASDDFPRRVHLCFISPPSFDWTYHPNHRRSVEISPGNTWRPTATVAPLSAEEAASAGYGQFWALAGRRGYTQRDAPGRSGFKDPGYLSWKTQFVKWDKSLCWGNGHSWPSRDRRPAELWCCHLVRAERQQGSPWI